MLLEDKDAKIADLEKRLARVERLLSRNSGNSGMPGGLSKTLQRGLSRISI